MSHWQQLKLSASSADADALAEALTRVGALSVTFEDAADNPILEPPPGTTPLWSYTRVVGLFEPDVDLAAVTAAMQASFPGGFSYEITELPEQDWVRKWMDDFKPLHFGGRLWVCPSWLPPPDPNGLNILLDPGLAFGTGTHASTALMLRWLATQDLSNQTVIDYGCGSGILAIAAAKLGAKIVYAVDHDHQAILATTDNANKNGVGAQIKCVAPTQLPEKTADLILANILAEPLIELAPRFATLVKPGGKIVLAGLLTSQSQRVLGAYEPLTQLVEEATEGEWHLICVQAH